ncbi:MAG: cupin domain-containing protein [Candidatus Rokubacteria bacterium]|nr:cupin domain-containing protein [Candidatus Rokubacteria bacterium]
MAVTTADLVRLLELRPHPEGGFFRETYRARETVPAFGGTRSLSTAIYFLLPGTDVSRLHRIKSDEVWHFYAGAAVTLSMIHADGRLTEATLGARVGAGERFQAIVPAGCWYGAVVSDPGGYALLGGTVAPGFDFADFELGERARLLADYPQHQALIERLTRRS